jgi:integrase
LGGRAQTLERELTEAIQGVPLLEVSKLLGHSSLAITMRYAHLAPTAFDAAIARLEAAD